VHVHNPSGDRGRRPQEASTGKAWAERVSHSRPGCEVLAYELALVERAITEQWPGESQQWVQQWILTDANRLHDPGDHRPECSFCAASTRPARAA
jgi:hypothetical protein